MDTLADLLALALLFLLLYGVGKVSHLVWWKPKRLERNLKQLGIRGTPYKLLVGDMKELVRLTTEAWSKPLSLTHQIVPRVDPFTLNNFQKYGISYIYPPIAPATSCNLMNYVIKDGGLCILILKFSFHREDIHVLVWDNTKDDHYGPRDDQRNSLRQERSLS